MPPESSAHDSPMLEDELVDAADDAADDRQLFWQFWNVQLCQESQNNPDPNPVTWSM